MTFRSTTVLLGLANLMMVVSLTSQAIRSSPTFDETAHFASGVILRENADAGYFKVNPPANKWITALATLGCRIELPTLAHSSSYSNRTRPEFLAGDQVLNQNREHFPSQLIIARVARIPMMLLGSWLLWQISACLLMNQRLLCMFFWCTSPLLLGHGWVVSADAPTAVAMCLILWTTVRLWSRPSWMSFAVSGSAWGLAIGTKFTFGPLYLAYPLLTHLASHRGWTRGFCGVSQLKTVRSGLQIAFRLLPRWILHASIACLVLNGLYLFHETGWSLRKHHFVSLPLVQLQGSFDDTPWVRGVKAMLGFCPCPFPRSFLEGVDQQLADMGQPRGVYLLGERKMGPNHWFFAVGYLMKEQLAVWLGIAAIVVIRVCRFYQRFWRYSSEDSCRTATNSNESVRAGVVIFCLGMTIVFSLLMSTQTNLVWNVRYLILVCPLIYLLIASQIPFGGSGEDSVSKSAPRRWSLYLILLGFVFGAEWSWNFPNHFPYINPMFGGAYRTPIALNDSNFDYGQDLWVARKWIEKRKMLPSEENSVFYGVFSGHGRIWLKDVVESPSENIVQAAIQSKNSVRSSLGKNKRPVEKRGSAFLLVSRGLFHPEPWAVSFSDVSDGSLSISHIQELLHFPPDEFVSPVIAVYRIDPTLLDSGLRKNPIP